MASNEDPTETLRTLFDRGLKLFNKASETNEPTNSCSVQIDIKHAMEALEKATNLVSMTGLFSTNETIDEVATSDLQYLLLPAILGSLTMKLTTGDRKEIIEVADVYFKDFLQRCNNYELSDYIFKDQEETTAPVPTTTTKTEAQQITTVVMTRQNKILRYKAQKELEAELKNLKKNMDNENADDEIKRKYFLTMIKSYILQAVDELASIQMEKPILLHMQQMKESETKNPSASKREPPKHKVLRPVIITKDEAQKAVFGLGYPSFPTMTVQEFYDKRVADGVFPHPDDVQSQQNSLQVAALAGIDLNDVEDIEKETNIQNDDPETLERMRNMDEFKDEHRRGYGNRMNRS